MGPLTVLKRPAVDQLERSDGKAVEHSMIRSIRSLYFGGLVSRNLHWEGLG